ncbi:MAG: SpoIIE family protein phosphatase, partial [Actinobacteria bacterium]|nr:SpoIIE family protein phosphatase [Actinomycetota bacterium]
MRISFAIATHSLQHVTARIFADSADLGDAVPSVLRALCEQLDASFGALWERQAGDDTLRVVATWRQDSPELDRFEEASRRTAFPLGLGLPGTVAASGTAHWIPDLRLERNFPRARPAAAAGLRCALAFPVRGREGVLGAVEVLSASGAQVDESLLQSLTTVGSQIGQYIGHARADVAARRSEALKATVLEAALDCIVIMDHRGRVVEWNPAAVEVFGYERAEVVGQEMAELIIPPTLRERHRRGLAHYLATGEGPVLGRRFEIGGMRADGSEFPVELAITPLEVDGEPLFTGHLRDITKRVQAEAERASLLERERLARLRAEQAERRAAFLAGAGAALSSSLDPEATLERVAELAVPELADWCIVDVVADGRPLRRVAVATSDEEKRELAFEIARRYRLDRATEGGMAKALGSGEPELIPEVSKELLETLAQDRDHLRMLLEMGLVSAMFVPLRARGRPVGAIALGAADSGRRFGREDLKTAEDLASRAATAIDNARLYRSRSDIASTLQRSLLPPLLPSIPGCELAARYRPAGQENEVGGDFYDVFELGEDRWALAIGDVCGKGAEAAATTGLARHTLRAAAMRESRPRRMLAVLNEALMSQRGAEELCTVALASLTSSGEGMRVTLACAGHPRPLVARTDGSVEAVGRHGSALGVSPELDLADCVVVLARGDMIVFYTDGLLDSQAPDVILGERDLIGWLRSCDDLDPAACAERLERAALAGADQPR